MIQLIGLEGTINSAFNINCGCAVLLNDEKDILFNPMTGSKRSNGRAEAEKLAKRGGITLFDEYLNLNYNDFKAPSLYCCLIKKDLALRKPYRIHDNSKSMIYKLESYRISDPSIYLFRTFDYFKNWLFDLHIGSYHLVPFEESK